MPEKKEYQVDDINPVSYVIHISDREFEPIDDTEFQVRIDGSTKSMTTDSDGDLKVEKPRSGEINLSI